VAGLAVPAEYRAGNRERSALRFSESGDEAVFATRWMSPELSRKRRAQAVPWPDARDRIRARVDQLLETWRG
jgi:hypothetical protein